jgi:serine/threonine protein kinase
VAIKEFYPQDHAARDGTTGQVTVVPTQQGAYHRGVERFMREGRILANLRHPHIIGVQNLFQDMGTAYLVMDLVTGQTLRQMLDEPARRGRLSEDWVETILEQMVDALARVHQAGVYHLDLKPDNVLINPEGDVILIDFGAARQGFKGSKTQAFSPSYAAPEVLGGKDVGPESDIFELGMMVYEMLGHHQPVVEWQNPLLALSPG